MKPLDKMTTGELHDELIVAHDEGTHGRYASAANEFDRRIREGEKAIAKLAAMQAARSEPTLDDLARQQGVAPVGDVSALAFPAARELNTDTEPTDAELVAWGLAESQFEGCAFSLKPFKHPMRNLRMGYDLRLWNEDEDDFVETCDWWADEIIPTEARDILAKAKEESRGN